MGGETEASGWALGGGEAAGGRGEASDPGWWGGRGGGER